MPWIISRIDIHCNLIALRDASNFWAPPQRIYIVKMVGDVPGTSITHLVRTVSTKSSADQPAQSKSGETIVSACAISSHNYHKLIFWICIRWSNEQRLLAQHRRRFHRGAHLTLWDDHQLSIYGAPPSHRTIPSGRSRSRALRRTRSAIKSRRQRQPNASKD